DRRCIEQRIDLGPPGLDYPEPAMLARQRLERPGGQRPESAEQVEHAADPEVALLLDGEAMEDLHLQPGKERRHFVAGHEYRVGRERAHFVDTAQQALVRVQV